MPCILDLYSGFGLVNPASPGSVVNFMEEKEMKIDRERERERGGRNLNPPNFLVA